MNQNSASRYALPGAITLLLVLMVVALGVGDMPLSPARIWAGLMRTDELAAAIIWQI